MNQESETFTQKDSKYKMLGLHLKECQEPRTTLAVEMPYQQLGRPHFWVRQPFARPPLAQDDFLAARLDCFATVGARLRGF